MSTWKRTVPRDIRPFFGCEKLSHVLEDVGIRIGSEAGIVKDNTVTRELSSLEEEGVDIVLSTVDVDFAEALGDAYAAYGIVLTIRDPTFKRRFARDVYRLSDGIPEVLHLSKKEIESYGHGVHLECGVSLCLLDKVSPKAGWPSVPGSWIARKKFALRTPKPRRTGFDIQPLTADIRRMNGLPAGTLVFSEISGDISAPMEEGDTFATCYVAESVLAAMRTNRESTGLNTVVEAELIVSVLTALADEVTEESEVVSGSPIESVLRHLNGDEPLSVAGFLRLCEQPQKMRALVHDQLDTVRVLEKM